MLRELTEVLSDPALLGVGAAASIVLLFVLAATNRVVVFAGASDFWWTVMIALIPLAWALALLISGGEKSPWTLPAYDWASVKAQPGRAAFILLGLALFAFAVVSSLLSSIANNGLLVGVLIFAFKVTASLFLMLIIPAVIYADHALREGNRYQSRGGLFYGIMAALGYLAYLLINGERVMERREALAEGA